MPCSLRFICNYWQFLAYHLVWKCTLSDIWLAKYSHITYIWFIKIQNHNGKITCKASQENRKNSKLEPQVKRWEMDSKNENIFHCFFLGSYLINQLSMICIFFLQTKSNFWSSYALATREGRRYHRPMFSKVHWYTHSLEDIVIKNTSFEHMHPPEPHQISHKNAKCEKHDFSKKLGWR